MKKIFIPLASDLMSSDEQNKLIESYNPIFENYGIVQSSLPLPKSDVYFFILTGGTENKFLDLIKNIDKLYKINILAIGINNSLPASLEILAYANQNGMKGKIYYLKNEKDLNGLAE